MHGQRDIPKGEDGGDPLPEPEREALFHFKDRVGSTTLQDIAVPKAHARFAVPDIRPSALNVERLCDSLSNGPQIRTNSPTSGNKRFPRLVKHKEG
jgi:hypothetical protein